MKNVGETDLCLVLRALSVCALQDLSNVEATQNQNSTPTTI